MVVAETLAVIEGIGLVTKSVQQIKSVLRKKDAQPDELASHIDNLFKAENQISSKSRNPVTEKWNRMLGKKLGDDADPTSMQAVVSHKIQQRQADEAIAEVKNLINRRFPGAWDEILIERQDRIEKAKTAKARYREKEKEKWDKIFQIARNILILSLGLGAILIFIIMSKVK